MNLKIISILTLSIATSSYADIFMPKEVSNKTTIQYFHRLLPTTTITNIYSTPYPDTYALVLGTNIVYGNIHSTYLTVGHMFDIYTKNDITANLEKTTTPKIDISKLNVSDAILAKSPNKVKKKLIVFVDPDCPYCRMLERQIDEQKINQKADLYYMLMPLPMHPNAKAHTKNILCSANPLETLKAYMLKGNETPKIDLIPNCNIDNILERTGSTARAFGVNGTPIIITGEGELIVGDDINSIKTYVDEK